MTISLRYLPLLPDMRVAKTPLENRLLDYPHIGTVRHDIHPGLRALPAGEKGVICFTVDDRAETVHIICVTYAGADWQARARGRS